MRIRPGFPIALLLAFVLTLSTATPAEDVPEYGPAHGTLIIIGGGNAEGTGIMERFIALAGGPEAKFVIVPTAAGNKNADGSLKVYQEGRVLAGWRRRGLKNLVMLHTADPKVADTEEFVRPLLDANAVWFDGGRQWNLVDSYANTRTETEFRKVLDRGGVIGGSSAGATIQGDYLVRGDTSGPDVMMTAEPNHQHGFDFLRHSAIDQHINTRMRWDDLIPVVKKYSDLLGIGLSEGTGIVVTGDRFEVMGKWKVAVHDNTQEFMSHWEKPYDVLSAGDVYNMKTQQKSRSLGWGRGRCQEGAACKRVTRGLLCNPWGLVRFGHTGRKIKMSSRPSNRADSSVEATNSRTDRHPTVKFTGSDRFIRELRKRVDAYFETTGYSRRDCPQMYFKTASILAWLIGSYVLLLFVVTSWGLVIPLAVILGLSLAAVGFNIQHDGAHKAYSDRRWVNKMMALTLDLIGGSSYLWDWKHNSIHHTYTNINGHDDDINLGWLGRLSPEQKWLPFHRLQGIYLWLLYGFLAIKWHLYDDFHQIAVGRIGEHKITRPQGKELCIFIGGKVIFLSLAFVIPALLHPIWAVLIVYAIAAFVSGLVLSIVFQLAHCVPQADFPVPVAGVAGRAAG